MMTLVRQTSPHARSSNSTQQVMKLVVLAAVPGLAVQTLFFGWGTLINVLWCTLVALASEAVILTLRQRPVGFCLADYSAVVTALLLALALPPLSPWWLSTVGVAFAIIVGKQLYGGLGYNPFNPAMLGYVLLLISFPQEMTQWLPPAGNGAVPHISGLGDALGSIFPFVSDRVNLNAVSMATPLAAVRENSTLTMSELWSEIHSLSSFAGVGWLWVNVAYLVGGLFLIAKKVFSWHAPLGMLAAMLVMSTLFWGGTGSESHGSPLFHLFSGATMLGAFFIITDPVSGATSNRGRLVFGAGVGLVVYVIRVWGGYPDAVAFATLLMNMAAPMIDHYSQPRTYGHKKSNKGMPKAD